ncbi:membrane peptidase [gut metagenome]|uniref:Membrane peptidase n=1 Tax=gut metagenome TaxID=749906 RepID=J9FQX0_9ZZZZ
MIFKWELYSDNLLRIMNGEKPVRIDSIIAGRKLKNPKKDNGATKPGARDSLLRTTVIKEEQFGISEKAKRQLPIEGIHFFTPLKGVVSQGYNKLVHPYIDITAPANSVVKSILDGTVISAGKDEDSGYTIHIQHGNNLVSVYKHNQKLLKKTGDRIQAGTPIALVGNTGKLSTGDHLHFELWYNGEAVDPTKYINF